MVSATFLDYAGVERARDMDSLSLRPFLEGKGDLPRTYITSALGNWRLVFDGRYKLIASGGERADQSGKPSSGLLLYDLKQDPHEDTNLAEKHPDVVERLKPFLPPLGMVGARKAGKKKGEGRQRRQKEKRAAA